MKVTYLIPGSGDNFYCDNCQRDTLYVSWLKKLEDIEVSAIPLYLPPGEKNFGSEIGKEIFFGAVSLYLKEKVPLFKSMPSFVDKILDSPAMLGFAAKQAGTTNPDGLEKTTLSMIRTNDPSRKNEIKRLSDFIAKSGGTDVIHISNALIMGLAVQLKYALGKPVVCSLQNEDDWINEMKEPYQTQAWELIAEEEKHIDLFISPSEYFKNFIISKTGIHPDKIFVVPSALEVVPEEMMKSIPESPSIGFYSRLNAMNGLDRLIDAFIILKKRNTHPGLKLHLSGGYTSDEKGFIKEQTTKLKNEGFENDVILYNAFSGAQKQSFFNSIDLLSVPVKKYDAFGLYLLEAISFGVPVVQPNTGAFIEIVESSQGGVIYSPDTIEKLADTLDEVLRDREALRKMGLKGRETINESYTPKAMALGIIEVYKKALGKL